MGIAFLDLDNCVGPSGRGPSTKIDMGAVLSETRNGAEASVVWLDGPGSTGDLDWGDRHAGVSACDYVRFAGEIWQRIGMKSHGDALSKGLNVAI